MTLQASGTITMQQIDAEFGRGLSLSSYLGTQWWLDNAATGFFDATNIDLAEFYSKRGTSPVTPGSTTISSSQYYTIPHYSTLVVDLRGGAGGGAGGSGTISIGSPGAAGGYTHMYGYGSADVGQGGQPGANGLSGANSAGSPAGGAGGTGAVAGGTGGAGGRAYLVLYNPALGGTGPAIGASVYFEIGAGGAGGAGGTSLQFYPGIGWIPTAHPSGSAGGAGAAYISWG